MNTEHSAQTNPVDLGDLLVLLWRGKWIILALAALITGLAVTVTFFMPNVYRSEVELKPVDEGKELSGLSGLATLGSLAGVNLGTGGVDSTDASIAFLQSRKFLVDFVKRHRITVALMAGKRWDEETQRLFLDSEIYDAQTGHWVRKPKPPVGSAPSDEEIYNEMRHILDVDRDPKTGLIDVSVTFVSPIYAQRWLSLLVGDLNVELQRRQIRQMERTLGFLERRLQSNTVAGMSTSLEQLYLQQLRNQVVAQGRDEFALETIDPANRPLARYGPNRRLIAILAAVAGTFLGSMGILLTAVFQSARIRRPDQVADGQPTTAGLS